MARVIYDPSRFSAFILLNSIVVVISKLYKYYYYYYLNWTMDNQEDVVQYKVQEAQNNLIVMITQTEIEDHITDMTNRIWSHWYISPWLEGIEHVESACMAV